MPSSAASARSAGTSACRRSRRAPTRSIRADPRCATTATAGAALRASTRLAATAPSSRGPAGMGGSGPLPVRALVRLDGPTVRTDYRMVAIGPDIPFLWSMHPLLALEPGRAARLIAGVAEVTVTNGPGLDLRTTGGRVGWPVGDLRAGGTVDLSRSPTPTPASRSSSTPTPRRSKAPRSRGSPTALESPSTGTGRWRRCSVSGSMPADGRSGPAGSRSPSSRRPRHSTTSRRRSRTIERRGRSPDTTSGGGRRSGSSSREADMETTR